MAGDAQDWQFGRPGSGRYTPRLDTLGQLQVRVLTNPVPVTVREISLGGFSLESSVPFAAGSSHRFSFMLEHGEPVDAIAECVYTRRLKPGASLPLYLSGFEFIPVSDQVTAGIAGLVYRIAEIWDWVAPEDEAARD